MKSGRQRRREIKEHRRTRALVAKCTDPAPWQLPDRIPSGAIWADQSRLLHDNTYGPRPRYYADLPFTCIECGTHEVWTAAQQKWWYEVAQGDIASTANRCAACRGKRRLRRSQERRIHIEGMIAKYGLAATAGRLQIDLEALQRMRARWTE